jgi:hypothetical protein
MSLGLLSSFILIGATYVRPLWAGNSGSRGFSESSDGPENTKNTVGIWGPPTAQQLSISYTSLPTDEERDIHHSRTRLVLRAPVLIPPRTKFIYFSKGNIAFAPFRAGETLCRLAFERSFTKEFVVHEGTELYFSRKIAEGIVAIKSKDKGHLNELNCTFANPTVKALQETLGGWLKIELLL